jgi:mycofactocin system glycosyltransferase
MTAPRPVHPLPRGFGVEFDPATRQLTDSILFGGAPARAMLLSDAGRGALAELRGGTVSSAASGHLARRLTDAGLAHPRPPRVRAAPDVTVLIPVRDRAALLDRCLQAGGGRYPVIVVDDGSADETAIAAVAARHGATVVRRAESGGPGAARNTGLAAIGTELVAFLDSDCVPPAGWIEELAAHLTDPLVGAAAPRIVEPGPAASATGRCSASRYGAARSSLDLGPGAARVVPMTRVSYVPTAALLVRRAALEAISPAPGIPDAGAQHGGPFDGGLRYGEDVDLVWRLHDAGWRIRYDPAVQVRHAGPGTWPGLLGRRFRYGTSAGPLARRHPQRLAPLVLQPWPAVAVAALLAGRPAVAAIATAGGYVTLGRTVRRAGLPATGVAAAALTSVRQTWLGTGRYATQFAGPALAVALAAPGGRTRRNRWGRRAAAATLLLAPVLDAWRRASFPSEPDPCQPGARPQTRPGPLPFALGHIADDIAYGAGVWTGCAAARTLTPVIPQVSWRWFRVNREPLEATRERSTAHGQHLV